MSFKTNALLLFWVIIALIFVLTLGEKELIKDDSEELEEEVVEQRGR